MEAVSEAEVVWQYLRWHGQYGDVRNLDIIKSPNLNDAKENTARFEILARDPGHVVRVRYPFVDPPASYRWNREILGPSLLASVCSNYGFFGQPITEHQRNRC